MGLLEFLKPNGAKILLFLLLLVIAPFPYFFRSETLSQYEVNWIWGFPPIVSLSYNFLPSSLQELNKGIFDISKVKTTFYWTPTYAIFIFLLSCVIYSIIEKIKSIYGIATFRGFLWRKLEAKPLEGVGKNEKIEEKKPKKEIKPETEFEEIDEKKIKEMSSLIKEEEAFLKEQKKKLGKYLDDMNIQKLKSIGVDVKENKIFCSECKQWKDIPKDQLLKLIEKYGFDIIWEYKCPDCGGKKSFNR
jgi:rubredoxin